MSFISQPIIPRAYIDNSSSLATCHICFQTSQEMFICRGACGIIYCSWCISQNKFQSCPLDCCPFSYLEPLQENCTYRCPYKQCTEKMKSLDQFWHHCAQCQLATAQVLAEIQYRNNYKCKKGHQLYLITSQNYDQIYDYGDDYATSCSQVCHYCKAQFYSKSICLQCGIGAKKGVYCVNCRPIPCEKQMCPIGHQLQHERARGWSTVCDFCGLRIKFYGNDVYNDWRCNYDICSKCHEKIPEKHCLTPLQNLIPQELRIQRRKQYEDSQRQVENVEQNYEMEFRNDENEENSDENEEDNDQSGENSDENAQNYDESIQTDYL